MRRVVMGSALLMAMVSSSGSAFADTTAGGKRKLLGHGRFATSNHLRRHRYTLVKPD